MALNNFQCNHLLPLNFKGLIGNQVCQSPDLVLSFHVSTSWHSPFLLSLVCWFCYVTVSRLLRRTLLRSSVSPAMKLTVAAKWCGCHLAMLLSRLRYDAIRRYLTCARKLTNSHCTTSITKNKENEKTNTVVHKKSIKQSNNPWSQSNWWSVRSVSGSPPKCRLAPLWNILVENQEVNCAKFSYFNGFCFFCSQNL